MWRECLLPGLVAWLALVPLAFMLWQSVYSEFYFTDVHWTALRRIDFLRAMRSFQQRDRRFGK